MNNMSQAAAPIIQGRYADMPASEAPCQSLFSPIQGLQDAVACVQTAAVIDVVGDITTGSSSEGACYARAGANWIIQNRHHRYWGTKLAERNADARTAHSRLQPIGTFGTNEITTPCGMDVGADGNLWVTSLGGGKVTVFSPEGDVVRHVVLPGSSPWGVFAAHDNGLWVCDSATSQLTRIGLDGSLLQRLDLPLPASCQNLRPILGAAHGLDLYLILTDGAANSRRFARISLKSLDSMEFLSCPVLTPSCVRVHGDRLFVSAQNPPAILSRPVAGGAWSLFNQSLVPEYLTQFRFVGDNAWITGRERLTCLGPTGAVEQVVDAGNLAGYTGCNFSGMVGLVRNNAMHLHIADNIHDLIHVFRLE